MVTPQGPVDVLVVGGGPAGLATAIRARLASLTVTVLERGGPPRDKACGEGLMPFAVQSLEEMGVDIPAASSRPFRGIRFVQDGACAEARFSRGCGLGVRRTVLHSALAERAGALGADLRWGVAALGLVDGGVETEHGVVRARTIVGADGLHSRVRRWAGLERSPGRHRRFGLRRHLAVEPWTDCVEVHWGDGCEAYVTPIAAGLVSVNFTWSGPALSFDEMVARHPLLAARLAGAESMSSERGAGPMHQRAAATHAGRVVLVGDAAGYLDSITGEGLGFALADAEAVVAAVVAGDPSRAAAAQARVRRVPTAFTHGLLLLTRHPGLRRRVIGLLARHAAIFSRALDASAGTRTPGVRRLRSASHAFPSVE